MIWTIAAILGGLVLGVSAYLYWVIRQLPALDEVDHG